MPQPQENFFSGNSPVAIVFNGKNFIGKRLCEELTKKNIRVICVDDFKNNYEQIERLNYVVDFYKGDSQNTKKLIDLANNFGAKYLSISTLDERPDQEKKLLQSLDSKDRQKLNFRTVRLGDVYGPEMPLVGEPFLSNIFKEYIHEGKIKVPKEEVYIYPLFVDDAVWGVVKSLLSPGTKGATISLIGERSTLSVLAETIKSLNSSIEVEYINQDIYSNRHEILSDGILREGRELINWEPHTTSTEGLAHTLDWFKKNKQQDSEKHTEPSGAYTGFWQASLPQDKELHMARKRNKRNSRKANKDVIAKSVLAILSIITVFLFWFLVFPFVQLLFGIANLQVAQSKMNKKDFRNTTTWINASGFWLEHAQAGFLRWSLVPFLKEPSTNMAQKGRVLERIVDITNKKNELRETTDLLFEKILGQDAYSVSYFSSSIAVLSSSLDQSLAFLDSEMQGNKDILSLTTKKLGNSANLSDLRSQARSISGLATSLPDLLGTKVRKTYLVLIQDNTQIRPGGGVVLGYGILTFDKGRLISGKFFKSSVADNQLKGRVEPPEPLAKYNNQETWTLKDVSWDQDFSLVAKKAIWFADIELDQKIDGVLSVDLDFLSGVVKHIGPIVIDSVNVDSENFYKIVLSKGGDEKQVIVVDIFNQIYNNLSKDPQKVGDLLGAISLDNLDQKHAMLFVNNSQIQNTINESGWAGNVKSASCSSVGACFLDYINFADANMGGESTNYYLKRSFSLDVFIQDAKVIRKLTVFYKNDSKNDYRNYFKVMIPLGILNPKAFFVDQKKGLQENLNLDLKNQKNKTFLGGYIIIPNREERQLMVSWESGYEGQSTNYSLLWQKQSGTSKDTFWLTINNLKSTLKEAIPTPSLTGSSSVGYNSTLAKDFSLYTKWQK